MAYDGMLTRAVVRELNEKIGQGKIEKVYQPEADELVFNVHSKSGNYRLFASAGSSHARVHFVEESPVNPPAPLSFCMLLRKHVQGGRITEISQKDCERIIEISLETLNELGFTVSKKLIFEIMGKHSNIILVDLNTGKIIDSIKRISFDVNRVRQLLPGLVYQYPPQQEKIPFTDVTEEKLKGIPRDPKSLLANIGGISPAFARAASDSPDIYSYIRKSIEKADSSEKNARVYFDEKGEPQEFYFMPLNEYEECCRAEGFHDISQALECYFSFKESSNQGRQKSHDLIRSVNANLDKMYLKKKRLSEDLLKAENSEQLRLYGELLQANLYKTSPGMKSVEVENYYNGTMLTIPLDPKLSAARNAQQYYKRYGKAKTAIHEKQIQLEENQAEIDYLESVLLYLENTDKVEEIEQLRQELVETGYVRRRKQAGGYKDKKFRAQPYSFTLKNGMTMLVGRNNRENDVLTMKTAAKTDVWFHTKDIHGSHAILQTKGISVDELDADTIYEAASIAAYYSKGRASQNVPVDYVPVRYVKKPNGAKPGMVIFTNNRTVWVDPRIPEKKEEKR